MATKAGCIWSSRLSHSYHNSVIRNPRECLRPENRFSGRVARWTSIARWLLRRGPQARRRSDTANPAFTCPSPWPDGNDVSKSYCECVPLQPMRGSALKNRRTCRPVPSLHSASVPALSGHRSPGSFRRLLRRCGPRFRVPWTVAPALCSKPCCRSRWRCPCNEPIMAKTVSICRKPVFFKSATHRETCHGYAAIGARTQS